MHTSKPIVEFSGICVSNEITLPDGSLVIDGILQGVSGFEVVNYNDGEPMLLKEGYTYRVVIYCEQEKDTK